MSEQRTKDSLLAPFKLSPEQVQRANDLADLMSARHFNYRDAARLIVGLHDRIRDIERERDTAHREIADQTLLVTRGIMQQREKRNG